jgi:tetratricopeptide (TPR) repeat protein
MRYRSKGGLTQFAIKLGAVVLALLVLAALALATRTPGPPLSKKRPTTAAEILAEASYFAFLHNWKAAAPRFRDAESLFAVQRDARNELYTHVGRLRGEIETHSLPEVSDYLKGVLLSPMAQSDLQLRLFCLVAKGDIDFQIDPKTSETLWNEVAAVAKRLGDGIWENRAQAELGTIAFYKGEVYHAARLVAQAYTIAEMKGDVAYVIRLRAVFGEGFAEFGHPKDALVFFDSALKLAKGHPEAGFPFTAYLGRGRALIALGHVTEGEAILRSALNEARQNRMEVRQARILIALGDLAKNRGQKSEARSYFDEAARLAERQHLCRLASTATSRLAVLSLERGESLADAERLVTNSIQNASEGGDAFHLPRVLATSAEIDLKRGNLLKAERTYELASSLVDRLLTSVTPFEQKDFLLASLGSIYLGQARLALLKRNPEGAFNALEEVYARGIAGSLRSHSEQDRLALQLTPPAAKRVNNLQSLLFHAQPSTPRSQILADIWETEKRGIVIWDSDGTPLGADAFTVHLSQLQHSLREDELVLEYALDEPDSILLAIDRHSIKAYVLPPRSEIDALIGVYLANINTPQHGVMASQKLGEVLLARVRDRPQNRLIVVGHGRLQALPFDALITADRRYLAETHIVTYSPSATLLYEIRSRLELRGQKGLLGVGAVRYSGTTFPQGILLSLNRGVEIGMRPGLFDLEGAPEFWTLPGSRRELMDAAAALPGGTLLLDSAATEEKLKSEPLDSYDVLHFAVHVAVDTDHPDRTALILADGPGSTEDGLLQAREIAHLRLGARLVASVITQNRPLMIT